MERIIPVAELKERFIKKHGETYDYSKITPSGWKDKVTIICKVHGEFQQIVGTHTSGGGCRKCGELRRLNAVSITQDEIINKIKEIHGDRYGFDKFVHTGCTGKAILNCKEHGYFTIRVSSILNLKTGCPQCGKQDRVAKYHNKFITEAKEKHGDKYDYSKAVYKHSHAQVTIICKIHGEFRQQASKHLEGSGCVKCGNISQAAHLNKTQEQFIADAKAVHGDKYDYSKTNYINVDNNVIIICPTHGEFSISPNNHIRSNGHGCRQCVFDDLRSSKEEFIAKARKVHGEKYNYDKVEYVRSNERVIITCPVHGDFKQTPSTHTDRDKSGCSLCNGGTHRMKALDLYFIVSDDKKFIKVGITGNIKNRTLRLFSELHTKLIGFKSFFLTSKRYEDGYDASDAEKSFKQLFAGDNAGFKIEGYGGCSEWFYLTEGIISWIKENVDADINL